ncbi:MAG: hypothetical protein ACRC9Y_10320 [Aeromonas veronii]
MGKRFFIPFVFCSIGISFSQIAHAIVLQHYFPTWNSGPLRGKAAGTCTAVVAELAPLSVPRTLVVDPRTPNGTVLYSWGYDEFIPSFDFTCVGTGDSVQSGSSRAPLMINFPGSFNGPSQALGYIFRGAGGIGLRVFYTATAQAHPLGSLITDKGAPVQVGVETKLENTGIGGELISDIGVPPSYFDPTRNKFTYKFRAELIKTGNIDYNATKPLTVSGNTGLMSTGVYGLSPTYQGFSNILGTGGITIVQPSCQLSVPTDYSVNLGRWEYRGQNVKFPVRGDVSPINLALECNGGVNNVSIAFQDAGDKPQVNGTVGLYDASGEKIEGLDIEILYKGSSQTVNTLASSPSGFSKRSLGPRSGGSGSFDNRIFTSINAESFGARFVQRAAIKKNGIPYVGPVFGRVNLFVTYN